MTSMANSSFLKCWNAIRHDAVQWSIHRASKTMCSLDSVPTCLWQCCSVSIPPGTVHRISWTFVKFTQSNRGRQASFMEGKSHKSFVLYSEIHPVIQLGLRITTSASNSVLTGNAQPLCFSGRVILCTTNTLELCTHKAFYRTGERMRVL